MCEIDRAGRVIPPIGRNQNDMPNPLRTTERMGDHRDITELLSAWSGGDQAAFDRLVPLVYEELSRIASRALRGEAIGHTLTTQALVHESYINLVVRSVGEAESRAHFFALAAKVMRRILIDHARRRQAQKRGGGQVHVTLGHRVASAAPDFEQLLDLDAALTALATRDPRLVDVVECRFFGGMTVDETAEALDVSKRTVEREWTRAKAYLYRDLTEGASSTLF